MKNRISKIVLIGAMALSLSACFGRGEPLTPTRIEYRVARPEVAYFSCERVNLPNPDTMTDAQVAELINELVRANRTCANNMNAIKQYLDAAEQILERVD